MSVIARSPSSVPAQRIVGFEPVLKVQESPPTPTRLLSTSVSPDTADDAIYRSLYIGICQFWLCRLDCSSDYYRTGSDFAVVVKKQAPTTMFTQSAVPTESPQSLGHQTAWITSAAITETAQKFLVDRSKAQMYRIQVESDKFCGNVWHRYSEFRQLYSNLVDRYGHGLVPEIPGKKYNKFSERVVSHRMATLNTFLEGICVDVSAYTWVTLSS